MSLVAAALPWVYRLTLEKYPSGMATDLLAEACTEIP
jgi:hypothetical protein